MVSQGSFSSDGTLVMGLGVSHDVYQATGPLLWDAGTHKALTVPWLKSWTWARFVPGRAELLTLRPAADKAGTSELALWPQAALARAEAGQALWTARVADTSLQSADASADGRWLAAAAGNRVLLWNRQTPAAPPLELPGHLGDVRQLGFSRDGRALVTASADRTARVWPLGGAAAGAAQSASPATIAPVVLKGGHSAALTAAAFSSDGQRVVTASTDNSLRLWDAASGKELSAIHRHAEAVNAVAFGPGDKALLSASDDGTVRLDSCEFCALTIAQLQDKAREATRSLAPLDDAAPAAGATAAGWRWPRWLGGT
jgi:WD40 repeat protein